MTNLERVEAMAGRAYGLHDVDRDALLWLLSQYRESLMLARLLWVIIIGGASLAAYFFMGGHA